MARIQDSIGNPVFEDLSSLAQSLSILNAEVLSTLHGQAGAAVQVTGIWTGTLVFEGTVDGVNWFSVNAIVPTTGAAATSTTANGQWQVDIVGLTGFRVRLSVATSGAALVSVRASQGAGVVHMASGGLPVSGTVTANQGAAGGTQWPVDTELPAAAALADAAANPTTPTVGADNLVFNGATWDRQRGNTSGNFVQGPAAHDAAIAGSPVRQGARASSTEPAAVADGDAVDLIADLNGKQVVMPYSVPERSTSGVTASITGTANTSVIAAPGAGLRLYITNILVTNGHATVGTYVNIKDGTTTIYSGFARQAGGGFAVTLPKPLRLSANTALQAANETTGSDTRVSASGYIAP